VAVAINGSAAHIVPLLTDHGLSRATAAATLGIFGLATMTGRLLAGFLVDRVFASYVATLFFLAPIAGFAFLASATGMPPAIGVVLMGMGLGTEIDLIAFLVTRYFGQRAFGQIYGCFFMIFGLGSSWWQPRPRLEETETGPRSRHDAARPLAPNIGHAAGAWHGLKSVSIALKACNGGDEHHGKAAASGIHRWGDRRHHHHHGIGDEGAAGCQPRLPGFSNTGFPQLCAELRLRRDLLEQPPPLLSSGGPCQRRDAVGQHQLVVLVSLVPFATAWMGQNHFAPVPTALYGVALLMPALAWHVLQAVIIRTQGSEGALARAIGGDLKGKISPVLYVAGILLAFVDARIACAIYLLVALMWLIPDRRIERVVGRR